MPTISDKIKRALAAIEQVRKDLNSVDEDHAAAETISRVLDGRRGELAEAEQRLAQIKREAVTADAEHTKWREVTAKERQKGNAEVDRLQEQLRVLDAKVKEARAEHDNILAGIAALHKRLRVS